MAIVAFLIFMFFLSLITPLGLYFLYPVLEQYAHYNKELFNVIYFLTSAILTVIFWLMTYAALQLAAEQADK